MEQRSLNQSAPRKAWEDTKKWLLDNVISWFLAFLLPGGGTMLATWRLASNVGIMRATVYGFIGGLLGLLLLLGITYVVHLVLAPIRQRNEAIKSVIARDQEIRRLTEQRLLVSLPEPRYDYLGDQWIRLRVENPTAIPIPECYGKLVSYRLASWESRKDGKLLEEVQVSPEAGTRTARQSGELPPQRHMFPWSPIGLPEITITIPGHNSPEFLYIAMKRQNEGCFYTPTDMGPKYSNYGMGNFELEAEIGSNSEPFKPTRVKLVFRAGGDLEAKKLELLPD